MKLFPSLLIAITLLASSCKRDEIIAPPIPEISPNYTPMSIGDYWIYEVFQVDSNGNDSSLQRFDSVYISNDTIINGHTYFVIRGTKYILNDDPNKILAIFKDSADYLVDENGGKLFSKYDFESKLFEELIEQSGDTLYYLYSKMDSVPIQYTVPAGTFNCLKVDHFVHHKVPNLTSNPKLFHVIYGNGVGLIYESYGFLSEHYYFERRLIRYKVLIGIP